MVNTEGARALMNGADTVAAVQDDLKMERLQSVLGSSSPEMERLAQSVCTPSCTPSCAFDVYVVLCIFTRVSCIRPS